MIKSEKQILRCPFCSAGQGEVNQKITYRRKGGSVTFELFGAMDLECYGCGKISQFERNAAGEFVCINQVGFIGNNKLVWLQKSQEENLK